MPQSINEHDARIERMVNTLNTLLRSGGGPITLNLVTDPPNNRQKRAHTHYSVEFVMANGPRQGEKKLQFLGRFAEADSAIQLLIEYKLFEGEKWQ